MKTIAVTNHKGGSAKTTTTVSLAAALGEQGFRVLVIDMDPQGSATNWLGSPVAGRDVLDVYTGQANLADTVVSTSAPGVQLIPATLWLVAADRRQETDFALGFIRTIEALPPRWDYVFVDCPPSQGYLAIAPLSACQQVLVPVEAHVLALSGLVSLLETMQEVRERLNPTLTLSAIVACRVSHTRHAREVVDRLRGHYPSHLLGAVVRENIRLAEAPSFQLPITRYAPSSDGAKDYRAVAREFLERQQVRVEAASGSSLARFLKSAQRHAASVVAWAGEVEAR
ncbi:MAG: ParA family protein [Candidatus Limnocylindrales bacterium]